MQLVSLTEIVIMLLLFHLLTICGVSPKPLRLVGGVCMSVSAHQASIISGRDDHQIGRLQNLAQC